MNKIFSTDIGLRDSALLFQTGGFTARLQMGSLTADRTIVLPDISGTIALNSQLPTDNSTYRTFGITIDGGSSVITTGFKGYWMSPYSGTIQSAVLMGNGSGSIVVEVWQTGYASFPPTVSNNITASTPPTLSNQWTSNQLILTGWTTAFTTGSVFGFHVNSVSGLTRATLELRCITV